MSEFKTRAEITSADEFIQFLELLRSGSLGTNDGINRALERLSENANALLDGVQGSKSTFLAEGGLIVLLSGTLAWTNDLVLRFPGEIGNVRTNVITSSSVVGLSGGDILYVKLDRVTNNAPLVIQVASSMLNYLGVISGQPDRLDYLPIAYYKGAAEGLYFFNGTRLLEGQNFTNGFGGTDSQYGQQTDLAQIRDNQRENFKLILTRGGDISWTSATGSLTFSENLTIEFPSSAGNNRILSGTFVLTSNDMMYVVLSRNPGVVTTLAPIIVANGLVPPTDDDIFVVAYHRPGDERLYLWDGTALSDGEVVKLGGARIGVQFFLKTLGTGSRVRNIQNTIPGATYRVGSGELMVYRNGIKAKASLAYWDGVYPAGGLNISAGGISASDDYFEEDNNGLASPLQGFRVLFIRDTDTPTVNEQTPDSFRALATNDPPMEYPDTDDDLEFFIGVQGQPPINSIPDGIYGFETVWTQNGAASVRTKGGSLAIGGSQYKNDGSTALEVTLTGSPTPPEVFPGDAISAGTWGYIYIGALNGSLDIRLSVTPPDDSLGGAGLHPGDARYFFLSSVFIHSLTVFRSFVKTGSWVRLDNNTNNHALPAFVSAVNASYQSINIAPYIPDTAVAAELLLNIDTNPGVIDGGLTLMLAKQTGTSSVAFHLRAIKPSDSDIVQYIFDVVCPTGTFDINLNPTYFSNVVSSFIIGYAEGRASSGDTLGA